MLNHKKPIDAEKPKKNHRGKLVARAEAVTRNQKLLSVGCGFSHPHLHPKYLKIMCVTSNCDIQKSKYFGCQALNRLFLVLSKSNKKTILKRQHIFLNNLNHFLTSLS